MYLKGTAAMSKSNVNVHRVALAFTACLAAVILTGCGVKKAEHEAVLKKLKEAESAIVQKDMEASQLKSMVQALEQKISSLEASDAIAYTRILPVERSGQLDNAKQMYETFLAAFPSSMLAPEAKAAIERITAQGMKKAATDEAVKDAGASAKQSKKGGKTADAKKKADDKKSGTETQKRFTPLR